MVAPLASGFKVRDGSRVVQTRYAKAMGARYLIATIPKEQLSEETSIREVIQTLRNIAEVVRKNGLRLLYHPHNC